ncbi:MAG: rhomboid family intramembrane serine protease [Bacteroidaceae bacterium]|jgi:membrane associated rhomboid family serine protease|nr:rhomboid family intramembrane serine protease [Bacteroidaceae bacterium]
MFRLTPVVKNLLIINTLCFAAMVVGRMYYINLNGFLGLHFLLAPSFHFWQPFTYMFMHGSLEHLFFNMFALWMFGNILEQLLGQRQFIIYYFVCGLGAAFTQEVAQFIQSMLTGIIYDVSVVGASGAVYGILLAFGYLLPNERIFIFPLPVPIRAKFFVVGYAVIELTSALAQTGDGVAHCAHLGGMLFGFLLLRHWRKMRVN